MVYLISVLGYKLSILILYIRLFAVSKIFRYLTWATMFFVCGYLLANLWTQIFGCSPRSKYWLPDTPGHCINYTKAGLAYGSMNIISDLIIFVLPLPIIWQLKLSRREKAGVSVIFMSGAMYVRISPIADAMLMTGFQNVYRGSCAICLHCPPERSKCAILYLEVFTLTVPLSHSISRLTITK